MLWIGYWDKYFARSVIFWLNSLAVIDIADIKITNEILQIISELGSLKKTWTLVGKCVNRFLIFYCCVLVQQTDAEVIQDTTRNREMSKYSNNTDNQTK